MGHSIVWLTIWPLASFTESQWEGERGSPRHKWLFIFGHPILEVTAHHFPFILFVRCESLGPAHTQRGQEMTQRREYQAEEMGGNLTGGLAQGGIELTYKVLWVLLCFQCSVRYLAQQIPTPVFNNFLLVLENMKGSSLSAAHTVLLLFFLRGRAITKAWHPRRWKDIGRKYGVRDSMHLERLKKNGGNLPDQLFT